MLKYFKYSYLVTVLGLLAAYLWGQMHIGGVGIKMLFVALFLAILEITLSFDNAIVNAMRLEKMDHKWQQCFLTWGILIAVFGMRLFFPIVIVSVFSGESMFSVAQMALNDITQYSYYLEKAHIPLVTFGGIFLFMIFFAYFFNSEKERFWLPGIEKLFSKIGNLGSFDVIAALITLCFLQHYIPTEHKVSVILSGIGAILTFLIINGATNMLETFAEKEQVLSATGKIGFINFLYLELIDASFSFDGLLGAFAISKDIIIITIGLAIGAMFVRSLTIFMVEKKTLKHYIYLEHGAHWAIGFLAVVMLVSTKMHVPEGVTGIFSLVLIIAALVSSIIVQKRQLAQDVKSICENKD